MASMENPLIGELANYNYSTIIITNDILDRYNINDYFNHIKNVKKYRFCSFKLLKWTISNT